MEIEDWLLASVKRGKLGGLGGSGSSMSSTAPSTPVSPSSPSSTLPEFGETPGFDAAADLGGEVAAKK